MISLSLEVEPMSYQRYSTNKSGFRFKSNELRAYQEKIAAAATRAGFHTHDWSKPQKITGAFFVSPMKKESKGSGSWGISQNQKDVDNLVKASLDALGDFFNDRIVAAADVVKVWHKDKQGLVLLFEDYTLLEADAFLARLPRFA